ncbi:s-methyl-5-thioribose-1-phosphate isomerase [Geminicoccaceae bacterium 1502E]|nr:s-methyl-5-thioribose-1-phosphate isomerase [Geminicoccaceae bacterium 1502E]
MSDAPVTLPTLLRESVLLEEGLVRILDRRVFPFEKQFVDCRTCEDVARAIEEMVTQSGGPFYAASAGMVLAAREAARHGDAERRLEIMRQAGQRLVATRGTNNLIARAVAAMLAEAEARAVRDADFAAGMQQAMESLWEANRARGRALGQHGASVLEDGDVVLTHCWAEATIIETLAAVLRAGRRVSVMCTETRPYLQGARLTAHSVAEMGIDVTVITDNMGAHAMDRGLVSRFMTAADRVTLSGHVINKVGTLQLALAARAFEIPYFAMVQAPDVRAQAPSDVPMEDRDPEESLHCLGVRTASPLVRGWYPAFDITPPGLVSGVVTSKGVFAAAALRPHFPAPAGPQA